MKVEWINPFIVATKDTCQTMLALDVIQGKPELLSTKNNDKDVSGVIGISGSLKGAVVIGFPKEAALSFVSGFLGEKMTSLGPDVSDAIGELANIIVGYAKKYFQESDLEISLPTVIRGDKHMITMPKGVTVVRIPFSSKLADFSIEVGIKDAEA